MGGNPTGGQGAMKAVMAVSYIHWQPAINPLIVIFDQWHLCFEVSHCGQHRTQLLMHTQIAPLPQQFGWKDHALCQRVQRPLDSLSNWDSFRFATLCRYIYIYIYKYIYVYI